MLNIAQMAGVCPVVLGMILLMETAVRASEDIPQNELQPFNGEAELVDRQIPVGAIAAQPVANEIFRTQSETRNENLISQSETIYGKTESQIEIYEPGTDLNQEIAFPENSAFDPSPSAPEDEMEQFTSVSQLADVQPTDWAYQALRSLTERYGCVAGYSNGAYQGNRALTRYEFAAGLDACLAQMNELAAGGQLGPGGRENLTTLRRLEEDFAGELATLRGRLNNLEARTAELETNQVSTTSRLTGEAIFSLNGAVGGNNVTNFAGEPASVDTNLVAQSRVRLNLLTSFTGEDQLRARLQSENAVPLLATGDTSSGTNELLSNEGRLNDDHSGAATNHNTFSLDLLDYRFSLGHARLYLFGRGGSHYDYAATVNPYFDDAGGGNGALSRFGERNPIYNIGGGGAGLGVNYFLNDAVRLDLGYLANEAEHSDAGAGLFNGNYSTLVQLVVQPSDRLQIGLTYVHAYSGAGSFGFGSPGATTGTFLAALLPGSGGVIPNAAIPVSSNSYGVEASFQVNPRLVVGGWVGYTLARLMGYGNADIWNYALTLAFPDLVAPGNVGGIILGSEPTLERLETSGGAIALSDQDDALHFEVFYRCRLTDNIAVTPGFIWLPALNQNGNNSDVFIGVLRTTFSF